LICCWPARAGILVVQRETVRQAIKGLQQHRHHAGQAVRVVQHGLVIPVPKGIFLLMTLIRHRITEAEYDFVLDTNLKGAFFVAQAMARRLIAARRPGRIINISSVLSQRVIGQLSIYCMSKIALDQMTRAMALEWGRHDINTNAICPGYIETEMNTDYWKTEAGQAFLDRFPRRRVGQPDDLDGALMLLAGPQGRFMNGSIISVDDGFAVGFK